MTLDVGKQGPNCKEKDLRFVVAMPQLRHVAGATVKTAVGCWKRKEPKILCSPIGRPTIDENQTLFVGQLPLSEIFAKNPD